ncbi:glycosyltransferase [Patescibacteria group bacterium]|nr:glycosyltransferase [Patescibacteria group bacterium]
MHAKVALIIRNLRQFGGGEKDLITLTEGLNKVGIVPDIFSEENTTDEEMLHYFGKKIQYTWKPFSRPRNILLRTLAEILLPHPLKNKLDNYDFVYDFTNKPPVLRNSKKYLKYIYVIEDKRVLDRSFYRKLQYNFYTFLTSLGIKKFKKIAPGIINVTQSHYIQAEIKEKTGIEVPIIYPPVDIHAFNANVQKKSQVICLGRISPEKNQLFVLKLAKRLKNEQEKEIISFYIIGINDDKAYYSTLRSYKNEHGLENVHFITNASRKEVKDTLAESLYFISATQDEHFGIAVVEGIASACVPLCHNSGGHKEVVRDNSLLFDDLDDAETMLENLLSLNKDDVARLQQKLQKHIAQYNENVFVSKMIAYLKSETQTK